MRRGLSRTLNETEPFRTAQRFHSHCLELILEGKQKRGGGGERKRVQINEQPCTLRRLAPRGGFVTPVQRGAN